MTARPIKVKAPTPSQRPTPSGRWLLFVHQLPSNPSNLRVRTWRRLREIGALAIRQALYVLPDSPTAREDFEWLKTEIETAGGQASLFAADAVDSWSSDALVNEFRRTRQEAYEALSADAEKLLKRGAPARGSRPCARAVQQLKERVAAVERIDFFGSAGRDRMVTLIQQLEARGRPPSAPSSPGSIAAKSSQYSGRLWVTRPRPGVDRMASAWLIQRFIDATARFAFVADRGAAPDDAIPFDMFGVEFTHRGDLCTFEMLCETFGLRDPALVSLSALVHDLDLKDGRFGAAEAPAIGLVIEGLQLAQADDQVLISDGVTLFEALYRAFEHALRLQGPRVVVKRRARPRPAQRSRRRR